MDIKVNKNTVVVFDLDDTLYNELDFLKSAYQSIAQHFEPKDWKPLYSSMFSLYRNKQNVFEALVLKYNIKIETLLEMYRCHEPKIKIFDGALELIHSIKLKNGKIGIVTDGRKNTQLSKIKALGIIDLIDKIVISEEIGTEKPDQANFKLIESAFPKHSYWYIADNLKKDFVAPNELNWQTVALIDNGMNIHYNSYKYLDQIHQPQGFVLSLAELNII
ncbi:HAD family hydrolase [Winogradskyella pulchriflava]|uniref:HAD family hydrolase n=1 Tax=Winogradskyella pulchriflava TaxID=1110688 RepID=A0ABV6QBS5_9FLAO